MAKINMAAFRKSADAANGDRVTVGNNRQIQHKPNGEIVGRLHGHPIVRVEGGTITLDTCGYATPTTRAAMQDFVEAATGFRLSVSFAKDTFTACYAGVTYRSDGNAVSFPA